MRNTKSDETGRNTQGSPASKACNLLRGSLSNSWQAANPDVAKSFVVFLADALEATAEVVDVDDGLVYFTASFPNIRLAGMSDAHCILAAEATPQVAEKIATCWRKNSSPRTAFFFIAANKDAVALGRRQLPTGRYVLLDPAELSSILSAPSPKDRLGSTIRRSVSLTRLIPFDFDRPVINNMFCGRGKALRRLLDEESVNFAVAGPGRIGKTSLVTKYKDIAARARDGSSRARFYIDLLPCTNRTPNGIAQYIALRIDSSSKTSRQRADRMAQFFLNRKEHLGRPVDLILDETDDFIHSETFRYLGQAARNGYCRLVLAGRGRLFEAIDRNNSPLQYRTDLLRLEALLHPSETAELLLPPFSDLGFRIRDRQRIVDLVVELTGALPHFMQYYGHQLSIRLSQDRNLDLTVPLVNEVRDSFETAKIFTDPIFELHDPVERLLALTLLRDRMTTSTLDQLSQRAANIGLTLELDSIRSIANRLVIHNILTWKQSRYGIANASMGYYARSQGFLVSYIRDTRRKLGLKEEDESQ